MSDNAQEKSNVVDMERYRQERTESGSGSRSEAEHVWEQTVRPLLPDQEVSGNGLAEVRIVKVSSGFGRLKLPGSTGHQAPLCLAA